MNKTYVCLGMMGPLWVDEGHLEGLNGIELTSMERKVDSRVVSFSQAACDEIRNDSLLLS